ncbi:MAG: tRNA (adenosine(37)-N6)-threonylcarbamoyltransferase complex ATPase subunit type 1 TsaE [Marinilabiliales bacterium]
MNWYIDNLSGIDKVAKDFLSYYKKNKKFAFYGEMGSGKTTFIKYLCKNLNCKDPVNSPTFSIINEYYSENFGDIFHMDLYRIKNTKELIQIGFEEYIYKDAFCFIEWPEIAEELTDNDFVKIRIEIDKHDQRVLYEIS